MPHTVPQRPFAYTSAGVHGRVGMRGCQAQGHAQRSVAGQVRTTKHDLVATPGIDLLRVAGLWSCGVPPCTAPTGQLTQAANAVDGAAARKAER
jgi:hypothetical protein